MSAINERRTKVKLLLNLTQRFHRRRPVSGHTFIKGDVKIVLDYSRCPKCGEKISDKPKIEQYGDKMFITCVNGHKEEVGKDGEFFSYRFPYLLGENGS